MDPTFGPQTRSRAAVVAQSAQGRGGSVPWWRWLQWQWWGLDLLWTRWWLSFDQASQQAWLQNLFGAQLRWLGVAILVGAVVAVAAVGCCCAWVSGLAPLGSVASSAGASGRGAPAESFPASVGEPRGCIPIWPRWFRPWRNSSSCWPMPCSPHPSAGTISANGGNCSRLFRSVDNRAAWLLHAGCISCMGGDVHHSSAI